MIPPRMLGQRLARQTQPAQRPYPVPPRSFFNDPNLPGGMPPGTHPMERLPDQRGAPDTLDQNITDTEQMRWHDRMYPYQDVSTAPNRQLPPPPTYNQVAPDLVPLDIPGVTPPDNPGIVPPVRDMMQPIQPQPGLKPYNPEIMRQIENFFLNSQ